MSLRIPPELKKLIELNAAYDGKSATQFVIDVLWTHVPKVTVKREGK